MIEYCFAGKGKTLYEAMRELDEFLSSKVGGSKFNRLEVYATYFREAEDLAALGDKFSHLFDIFEAMDFVVDLISRRDGQLMKEIYSREYRLSELQIMELIARKSRCTFKIMPDEDILEISKLNLEF